MALWALSAFLLAAACAPASGEDTAFRVPDFSLHTVSGEVRTLNDFKAPVTLINFFFPT